MDLSYEDLERYLLRIFTGEDIINVRYGSDTYSILFKFPNNSLRIRANLVYDLAYNKAIDEGLLPLAEIESIIKERNIFTDADQKNIDSLENKLKAQKVVLSKTTKVKANSDRIKKIIYDLEIQINEIKYKKYSKVHLSADHKAEEERQVFLCNRCSYSMEKNELFWTNEGSFKKETRLALKDELLKQFSRFYNGISQKVIRTIARHSLWRIRYVNSIKTSEGLFGVPGAAYTHDQLNLAYWSNYYQSIYEMMPDDRPSDLIIEDDDSLDAYMTAYYEERSREDAARKSKHKTKGTMSAFDKEEVIVTRSNELYEDIKYDKPREAQQIKDKNAIKKRTKHSRR